MAIINVNVHPFIHLFVHLISHPDYTVLRSSELDHDISGIHRIFRHRKVLSSQSVTYLFDAASPAFNESGKVKDIGNVIWVLVI